MQPLREEASHACCAPFFPRGYSGSNTTCKFHRPSSTSQITSTRASRSSFVTTTNSTILSSSLFTNHESLPRLSDALSNFLSAYPNYPLTQLADRLRLLHYPHLSLHIPLDYTGFALFSPSQLPASSFTVVVSSHNPEEEEVEDEEEEEETNNNNNNKNTNKIESAIKRRIMSFLNLSPEDYLIILTVNRASALKLLAESYPFHSHKRLLTVYDHESEAVSAMLDASSRRQAKLMSASFQWPSMRIHSSKLKKMLSSINISSSSKGGGLFLLPLQSRVTGTRYSHLWLARAQQNGWHVALDACGLSPKDMDTLGLSLFHPDFLVCNFFKVFGEDPSGFSCLIVRRDIASLLEISPASGGGGLVRIVPTATHKDDHASSSESKESTTTTFGELSVANASDGHWQRLLLHKHQGGGEGVPTTSSEIIEEEEEEQNPPNPNFNPNPIPNPLPTRVGSQRQQQQQEQQHLMEVECRGLDHADSLGLALISSRLRCIVNWLVVALTKLRHPHSGNGQPLVSIYGPRVKFDRGHSIAFNLFDWKGEKVDPSLVQKLADRSNISLTCSFLQNIFFSDKYGAEKQPVLEKRLVTDVPLVVVQSSNNDDKKKKKKEKKKENLEVGINVVSLSLGFLASFEDAYNLWMFIAKFLDADFVEKERWRYVTLNQKTAVV